jgi:hypothetical protein
MERSRKQIVIVEHERGAAHACLHSSNGDIQYTADAAKPSRWKRDFPPESPLFVAGSRKRKSVRKTII